MYPRVSHGLRPKFVGGMQDPYYPRFSYVNNHAASHADAENSFLALLSGPPSLLQCEFHELSDSKPCMFSANFPTASGNFVVDSVGSGTFLTTTKGLPTEKISNHKMQIKVDAFPAITSRAMIGPSSGVNYVFPDSRRADTSVQPSVPCSEKAREPLSSKSQCWGTTPASNLNICSSDIQAMPNVAFAGSSSKTAIPFMSGCPRVFCMGKSGCLLLSNTGLLGIVCSCHCHHMSVLKFCEHSGLFNVNPGDAVHMESGETIAQWQKLYFLKFGIRSPGNESEWDWPEVLSKSATASLMKSNGTNSNMSQGDLSHLFNSPAVSLQHGKPSDNVVFPKDAHADHHLFVGTLSEKQQTTVHDGCNIPIKGFSGNIQNNLPDRASSQLMEFNLATCFTPPNLFGTQRNDGCEVTTAYLDSLNRNGNSSIAYSPLQNPISLWKDLDFTNNKKANEGFVGRDASSSNIELRLGQPPQTGNPVLSSIEPQQFDALVSPQKLQYLKQMTHHSPEPLSREEELSNNFFYAAGPSNTKMVEEQSQLKLRNAGFSNVLGAARARSETDVAAKGFGFSPYTHCKFHSQGNMKANENLVNDGGLILSRILQYGSNTLQSGPSNVLWNRDDHIERQLNDSSLGSNKFLDNDKGVGCAKEITKIDSGSKISKLMEYPSFMREVGGSSGCCFPALNGKISCHDCEPSMTVSASAGTNISCHSKKNPSVGQDNHVTLRSWGSQMASGMLSEGILMGCPFIVSSSTSDQTPSLLEQEGSKKDTCLLDENMRLLALTQILELSKHQHALYLHEMNRKQGRSCNCSNIQHGMYEASTSKHCTSEVTLKSSPKKEACGNHGIIDDLETLASLRDLNRHCSLSTVAPISLRLKEEELQCQHSCDLRNEEPSLSLGRSKGITRSCECGTCSEQPSDTHLVDKYTCATKVNCLGNKFILGVGPSSQSSRQQLVNTSGEASLMIASNFTEDQTASKYVTNQFVQGAKFDVQDLNKFGSHTPQWRDVPSKIRKAVCDAGSLDQPAVALDCVGQGGDLLGNVPVPVKRLKRTFYVEDSLKEQESSNVSSGCSAPVITQSSIDFNNADSSTVDAVDNQCFDNLVVDEGSGIEKSWSSDALESDRSSEFLGSTCGTSLKKAYLRVLNDQSRCSILDELKLLDSLTWKKGRDQNHTMLSVNSKTNQYPKVKRAFKDKKQKRMGVRMLDAMFPSGIPSLLHNENDESTGVSDFSSNLSKEMKMYFASSQQKSTTRTSFVQSGTKKRAAFSSKLLSCKSYLRKNQGVIDEQNSNESETDCDAEFNKFSEVSGRKKLRKDLTSESFGQFEKQEPACEETENAMLKSFYSRQVNAFRNIRPVVFGKYGEISRGMFARDVPKPAKIVSLSKVLKASEKCEVPKNGKSGPTSKTKWNKLSSRTSKGLCFGNTGLETKDNHGTPNALVCDETNVDISKEDLKISNKPLAICKVKRDVKPEQVGGIVERIHAPLKLKSKEIRKRSIYELTAKGENYFSEKFSLTKVLKSMPETRVKKILEFAEDREHDLCNTNSKKSVQEHRSASNMDSDAFCCVCRSSSNDKINCLLECSRCLIKVHQACYGISTIPKGRWHCRPCRTNSKDIACVLCGYGGGAMNRALRSHTIVKSLLKVWNIEKKGLRKHITVRKMFEKEMSIIHSTKSAPEGDQNCASRPENIEPSTTDLRRVEMSTSQMQQTPYSNGNFSVCNSITAGVLDSTVKQWVHMVCGLWTPGTRCPNVDTMNAFDVFGVSCPKADTVCSICNRWGGSCIKCRVVDCSVQFHPWCAHQKNLLQNEAEGVDDEKVGFYGICALHADDPICQAKHDLIGNEMACPERMQATCARTEGYKGRRRDGFQHNPYDVLKGKGGCLVPQEQLNAWIHINGQKFCLQGLPKFPASDIEYDCRKEYARYKQARGWKHLVVYKSGIHALGLYTSRFISRGEMVVEYVGEIVGQRVADKREIEYQSWRKLQYKSACYFFRIDKEHIIDATRKGGIARFVNHSCLPNCVAKVITIRHEKKVVFFAERDVFPGEEITYDYHFNHEDEGQKIPCYCNSKNCRRYLN